MQHEIRVAFKENTILKGTYTLLCVPKSIANIRCRMKIGQCLRKICQTNEKQLAQFPGGYWLLKFQESPPTDFTRKIRPSILIVYLLMVVTTTYSLFFHREGENAYWCLEGTRIIFTGADYEDGVKTVPAFRDVNTIETELWPWLEALPDRLGRKTAEGRVPSYALHNIPLGSVRIRQQRARRIPCSRKEITEALNMTCSELWPPKEKATITSIKNKWANRGTRGGRLPYEYSSEKEPIITGSLGRYEGDGYMVDYNLSTGDVQETYSQMKEDLSWLKENGWLDLHYTRSVVISFTVFNVHYDMWQSVDFLFEIPPNGGEIWKFANIIPFRPGLNETGAEMFFNKLDYLRIILSLFLLLIIRIEISHKVENQKAGIRYFTTLNGITDVGVFTCVWAVTIIRMIHFNPPGASDQTRQAIIETTDKFKSWTTIANLYNEIIILEGVLFFLTMCRILSFIRLGRHMYLYWHFLGRALHELAFLSILLVPAFCGFVMMTSNIFANYVQGYDNSGQTVMSLLSAVKGDFDLESLFRHDRLWTLIFCIAFFFFVPFLMMNTFVVIMIDAYYTIQLTEGGDPREYRWNRYQWMRWLFPNLVINNLPTWLSERMFSAKGE